MLLYILGYLASYLLSCSAARECSCVFPYNSERAATTVRHQLPIDTKPTLLMCHDLPRIVHPTAQHPACTVTGRQHPT
jgi:hypothetical protein